MASERWVFTLRIWHDPVLDWCADVDGMRVAERFGSRAAAFYRGVWSGLRKLDDVPGAVTFEVIDEVPK